MKRILLAALCFTSVPAHSQQGIDGNPEMAAIFAADQAVRSGDSIDPQKMMTEDAERRRRTRELLDQGALTTGPDFYAAAFVFQHGSVPEDYLLAHVLAVRALGLGMKEAEWIAAATLDRYLHNTGKSQIYGTQYTMAFDSGKATMEPYDRQLLTDALRIAAGTRSLAEQEARLPEMEASMKRPAPAAGPAPNP